MTSRVAIRTEGLSKDYLVGVRNGYGYDTLRERLSAVAAAPFLSIAGRPAGPDRSQERWLHALTDLSLTVYEGEVVGLLGNNGAGKSTLLKVLSRITEPTSGRAEVHGRIGSLLEVGTGFHPELTGRENIYLNGAILGMRQAEIRRQFDEIVAFADLERFLDTPVKRYSSGMYVRLAFSVAAHLRTEILVVDEVLSVGDAAFQRKSLGRMGDVAQEGRTVVFVSHNMAVIQALCSRGIYLHQGKVLADAPVEDAIRHYLSSLERAMSVDLEARTDRRGWQNIKVRACRVTGEDAETVSTGRPARFCVELTGSQPATSCRITIVNGLGQPVCSFDSSVVAATDRTGEDGFRFVCVVDQLPLLPGRYRVDVAVRGTHHLEDDLAGAAVFDVEQGLFAGRPAARTGNGDIAVAHWWLRPAC